MAIEHPTPPAFAEIEPAPRRRWLAIGLAFVAIAVATWVNVWSADSAPARSSQLTPLQQSTHFVAQPTVAFADQNRGYALIPTCNSSTAAPTAVAGCDYRLWVTGDGGQTWRGYPVSAQVGTLRQPTVLAVGQDGVLMEDAGRRWFSPDRGLHWRLQTQKPTGQVMRIPTGSLTTLHCTKTEGRNTCRIIATLPNGRLVELAQDTTVVRSVSSAWQPVQRSEIAHTGWDRAGRPIMILSNDAGQSWRSIELPASSSNGQLPIFRTNYDAAYLSAWKRLSPGGLHNPTAMLIRPDGSLLVLDRNRVFTTDYALRSLTEVSDAPQLQAINENADSYLGVGLENDFYLSATGDSWRRIDLSGLY